MEYSSHVDFKKCVQLLKCECHNVDSEPESHYWAILYQKIWPFYDIFHSVVQTNLKSSCGRQKGPSMMTQYARSYSLQKGPSLEDSVE